MLHIKKIKPLFSNIITTGDMYEEDMKTNGLITAKRGDLKLYQKVLAVGPMVRDINIGDTVMIDASHFAVRRFDKNSIQNDMDNNPTIRYEFNCVTLDDSKGNPKECLMLSDRDILYVFEGEEVNESIVVPKKKVLLN